MIIMTMIIVFLVLCDGDPTLLGARMGLQENDQKGGCFSESYMASIVYLSVAFVSVIFLDMISTLYIYMQYICLCVYPYVYVQKSV